MRVSGRVFVGAGAIAILLAGALIAVRAFTQEGTGAAPSPTLDPDPRAIRPGAEVRARGTVAAIRFGGMCIAYGESRLLGREEPRDPTFFIGVPCRMAAVPITGVDPTRLPQWTQWSRFGFSAPVLLKGRWTGGAIEVRDVGPYEFPPRVDELGCAPAAPARGQAGAGEASFKGLASIVFGDPEGFAGYWPLGDARNTAVVGTVRDPDEVGPRLEAAFPFAMCVVKVRFSQAQLDAAAAEIRRDHPDWISEVRLERNRVRVVVPVLDGNTLRELDRYPAASPLPVVEEMR